MFLIKRLIHKVSFFFFLLKWYKRKKLQHAKIKVKQYINVLCFCVSLCFAYLGPSGVGMNELKRKLLISDPQHFSVTIPRKSFLMCVCVCVTVWDWFLYLKKIVCVIPFTILSITFVTMILSPHQSQLYLTHSSVPSSSAHSLPPASRNAQSREIHQSRYFWDI